MFHGQHVSHKWHVCLFISFQEPPVGVSSVGSFPVWPGGSLIIFPAL